jgi:hypothetical protein
MDEACFIWEEFSTAITAMFRWKQTFMLHLFTATNNGLWLKILVGITHDLLTGPYL